MAARVSTLVAFRDTPSGERGRVWRFLRERLEREHPDFEIVVESDDGIDPFHKTLALNRAAARASGDVFYLIDADTYAPAHQVTEAVEAVACEPSRWWRPWNRMMKLAPEPTRRILDAGGAWDGTVPEDTLCERRTRHFAAVPRVVSAELFWSVGGFDERFRGWGYEDVAFCLALRAFAGPPCNVIGVALHLHHPRIGRVGADCWPGQRTPQRNRVLAGVYADAYRSHSRADAMRSVIARRRVVRTLDRTSGR